MQLKQGSIIKGYKIIDRITEGGFGEVYSAHHTTVNRDVAIKMILPQYANTPDFIRRFEAEAQVIARLEHPYIVPLYDYWRDPMGAYLVMRLLRGGSLKDLLKHQGALSIEETVTILEQICQALHIAHRNQVVHRDIKPGNILLDEDGNAYLADFGIAKDHNIAEGYTNPEGIVGSPDYLAPEQARSERVTPKTDIYSLGVVLYEMLVGEHPFPNLNSIERLYKHLNDLIPDVSGIDANIAYDINVVIQNATAKNPKDRYDDALALARAFREAARLDRTPTPISLVELLTPREQEVLKLIVDGKTNRQISDKLVVEVSTVKWYINQIYKKLGVRSRVQAIVKARDLDLINIAPDTSISISVSTIPEPENPYKGLQAFQTADAQHFFGREKLTNKLLARLQEKVDYQRFLAVVGPSGSGKSSVVKAGLIPEIWRGAMPKSNNWYIVDMLPGKQPLDELEVALYRIAADTRINLREQLERDNNGLLRVTNLILPDDGSELLLVIDQFEEVFTLLENEEQRQHFLSLIREAVIAPRSRVRVVVTLRADYYDKPLQYPEFGEMMRNRVETILPLSAEELERAIYEPARQAGVRFEDGLVSRIVSDVHYQPGALPLLQYAMTELFERHEHRLLTMQAYQTIGGTGGALANRADEIFKDYDDAGQELVRQMFLRLVTLGEGAEDTRRRTDRAELLAITDHVDLMDDIIDTYAESRLLSLDHDPTTRQPTVEVAHEAILREWDRLRQWLNVSREDIRQERIIAQASQAWQDNERDKSYLLSGVRLAQAQKWQATTELALTPLESQYIQTSIEIAQAHEQAEAERRVREVTQEKRSRNLLRILVVVFAIAALGGIGLSLFAFDREEKAQSALKIAEREAEVNHSLVTANTAQTEFERGFSERALALALESANIPDPPQASIAALTQIAYGAGTSAYLRGHTHPVYAVAFSTDQTIALSGSCASLDETGDCSAGEIIVWDLVNRSELTRLGEHTDQVNAVAFQPGASSHTALSASKDGDILLWDINTREVIRRFVGHDGGVNAIAFSPDGHTFLSGGDDGIVLLWDVNSGDILQRFAGHDGGVNTIAFSPDGQTLLSGGGDSIILLWDVNSGEILRHFIGHTGSVNAVAFRPGASEILSTGADFSLRSWELETGDLHYQFNYAVNLFCLVVTPDGRTAAVCADYGVNLWDLEQQASRQTNNKLMPSIENVASHLSLVISPDAQQLMAGLRNGLIVMWSLGVQPEISRIELPDTLFSTVDIRHDGRYLLLGSTAGSTILWDAQQHREIRRFEGQAGVIAFSRFTPDGRKALIGSSDWFGSSGRTDVILWDIETGEIVYELVGHRWWVRAMAFSPDGRLALTGSQPYPNNPSGMPNGDLILWNLETGEMIWRVEHLASVTGIAFNADGSQALTASDSYWESVLTIWDVATGQPIREFQTVTGLGNYAVAYSPDENAVLTAEGTGTILLRDLVTGKVLRTFAGHENWILSMTVSPDKRFILSGDDKGLMILWDYATGQELRRIQAHQSAVYWIAFTQDGLSAFTSALGGPSIIQWQIVDQSLDELRAWISENRYVAEFTCTERELYRIEPLCAAEE